MFLSHSTGRKVLVTAIAVILFAVLYEVTFLDSRFAARQADQELTASPALGVRLRFTATGYCRGTTTASGVNVRSGIAAADRSNAEGSAWWRISRSICSTPSLRALFSNPCSVSS